MSSWSLNAGLQGGTWQWPVDRQVYLLLDGVRVDQLARRLYEWASEFGLEADLLYAGTPLAEVSGVSPWLITLPSEQHPVLQFFLAQGLHEEWGYLLESKASLEELGNYLRKLLQVRHPSGVTMWLRLADPAVIAALLPDQSNPAITPWGPIDALLRPDSVTMSWHQSVPASHTADAPLGIPQGGLQLNETQLACLQACDKRRDLRNLMRFVDAYCSNWALPKASVERYDHLAALTDTARQYGFTTPRQWGLLCTLLAKVQSTTWELLSENVPQLHAHLTRTLDVPPAERLKTAQALSSTHAKTT
ncbi:DUF4123 domain-containing protein [Halomonas sp. MC140]|nr:DUF4123 domain-containing protein [Halomonas sp. MC140]MDN7131565.1 DUF4123 domain-containing protein [Halomonas sp. MC140]